MNNENEKDLDNLFKKKLEDPVSYSATYKDEDWASLEKMLDKHYKRRGVIYWLPVLSGVAALLLLSWGWWFFETRTKQSNTSPRLSAAGSHQQPKIKTEGNIVKQYQPNIPDNTAPGKKQAPPASVNYANNNNHRTNSGRYNGYSKTAVNNPVAPIPANDNGQKSVFSQGNPEILTAVSDFSIAKQQVVTANPVVVTDIPEQVVNTIATTAPAIAKVKTKPAFRPQYALSVLASSDANGVSSFQQSKLGSNVGLLFSVEILKKLTISTGGVYSIKPYVEGLASYNSPYKPPGNPVNVIADCRVLDIPLNIDYRFYNKGQNKLSIGTGLSSYLMLKETFNYNYAEPFAYAPKPFTVFHSGNYLLGVLNVNATYERQINQKVGISIEPYLKLPLTNIGYSQVRLQTTGVAVGLTWNLNSFTKP